MKRSRYLSQYSETTRKTIVRLHTKEFLSCPKIAVIVNLSEDVVWNILKFEKVKVRKFVTKNTLYNELASQYKRCKDVTDWLINNKPKLLELDFEIYSNQRLKYISQYRETQYQDFLVEDVDEGLIDFS